MNLPDERSEIFLSKRNKSRRSLDLPDKGSIDFSVHPFFEDTNWAQKDNKMGASFDAFFNLPAQAISAVDRPGIEECIDSGILKVLSDSASYRLILTCVAQEGCRLAHVSAVDVIRILASRGGYLTSWGRQVRRLSPALCVRARNPARHLDVVGPQEALLAGRIRAVSHMMQAGSGEGGFRWQGSPSFSA